FGGGLEHVGERSLWSDQFVRERRRNVGAIWAGSVHLVAGGYGERSNHRAPAGGLDEASASASQSKVVGGSGRFNSGNDGDWGIGFFRRKRNCSQHAPPRVSDYPTDVVGGIPVWRTWRSHFRFHHVGLCGVGHASSI